MRQVPFPLETPRLRPSAFSLLEMLVVISIIGILAVFIVPAATTIVMGTELTRGSQMMMAQFALARQTAMTKNHQVEVRLMAFADPEQPGESADNQSTWKYRGVQVLDVQPNGAKFPVTQMERLPGAVQMNEGVYSSFLNSGAESSQRALTPRNADDTDPQVPRIANKQYRYVLFHFLPDGSTDLQANGKWYVTLLTSADQRKLSAGGAGGGGGDPIKSVNYFTLQVDPTSGTTRAFRPTIGTK